HQGHRDDAARAARRLQRGRNVFVKHVRRDDGGVIVLTALLLPFAILLVSLSVDIGNWWVHKRHLQLQADAAALAGGALLGNCFSAPTTANTAITNEATRFGGGAGSSYNEQVGGTQKGTVSLAFQ